MRMFDGFRFWFQLSRLQRRRRWLKSEYKKNIIVARKEKKSLDEILGIYQEESNEIDILDSEIGSLVSQRLLEEADFRFLPRPDLNDKTNWISYSVTGTSHLSAKAITELSAAIDKHKNDRWQFYELRFKVVAGLATALTGAAGALIGLIAIWK